MSFLPEKWRKYSAIGKRVPGTNFLPFKVPLKQEKCCLPEDEWFSPNDLLDRHGDNLKVVIDLTNTDKYYDPKALTEEGVIHRKIKIKGRGELPTSREEKWFLDTVDYYLDQFASDPNALIGVHCTHGLNRTGYFICYYMVQRLKIDANEAIRLFEAARGHPIERYQYTDALRRLGGKTSRYSSPLDDVVYQERPTTWRSTSREQPRRTDTWTSPNIHAERPNPYGYQNPRDHSNFRRRNFDSRVTEQGSSSTNWRNECIDKRRSYPDRK